MQQQFIGTDPGNTDTQMLFTVWEDGSATVAYRDTSGGTWGPPHDLDPA
jgi:hypothetical protein